MAKIQSIVTKQNLQQFQTLFVDTSATSPYYFNLSQVPDVLTSGRNTFLIGGAATQNGTKTLVAGSVIKLEILDVNGNPIFLTPVPNYTEGNSDVVSIEIYAGSTPPGPAVLTILGQAYLDPDGNVITDPMWTDAYNVKWQKTFSVQPYAPNNNKIRFFNIPTLNVTEQLGPYRVATTGSSVTINTGLVNGVILSPNSPNYLGVPATTLQASGFVFTTPMIGGTFSAVVSGAVFSSSIVSLYNSGTALLTSSITGGNGQVVPFTTTNFGINFTAATTYSITAVTRSYANATLTNLNTFSGEVARAKIYATSLDQPGNPQQIADISVEENELTVTESIATANMQLSLGRNLTPFIIGQYWEFGSAFFTGTVGYLGPYNGQAPTSDNTLWTASYSSQYIMDAAHLLEATGVPPNHTGSLNFFYSNTSFFAAKAWIGIAQDIPFDPNSEYTLSCSLFCAISGSAGTTLNHGYIEAYLFGPAFPTRSGQYNAMLSSPPGPDSPYGHLISSWYVQSSSVQPTFERFDSQDINFVPLASGTARLRFVIYGGDWHISNVAIYAGTDIGYNANTVNVVAPMPTTIPRFSQIQFKAELYDVNNNLVALDIEDGPVFFQGSNTVLLGTDHQVQGVFSIVPSGTTIQYPLRLSAQGFNFSGSFVTGSAFMLGSGNFAAQDTPILIGADSGGNPYVSLGTNLIAYNIPGVGFQMSISGNLAVQGTASFAFVAGAAQFAVRSSDKFGYEIDPVVTPSGTLFNVRDISGYLGSGNGMNYLDNGYFYLPANSGSNDAGAQGWTWFATGSGSTTLPLKPVLEASASLVGTNNYKLSISSGNIGAHSTVFSTATNTRMLPVNVNDQWTIYSAVQSLAKFPVIGGITQLINIQPIVSYSDGTTQNMGTMSFVDNENTSWFPLTGTFQINTGSSPSAAPIGMQVWLQAIVINSNASTTTLTDYSGTGHFFDARFAYVIAIRNPNMDTEVQDGNIYARTNTNALDGFGNVNNLASGTQLNDGAGNATGASRVENDIVQHGQAITFANAYQNNPRVAYRNIRSYEPRSVWGTYSQITLQSGNSSAPSLGSAGAPMLDLSTPLNLTPVGNTVQAVLFQPAIGGTNTQFVINLANPGSVETSGNGASTGSIADLPSNTGAYKIGWTGGTGWRPGTFKNGNTTGDIVLELQFSPNNSSWTTIGAVIYSTTGVGGTNFTVGADSNTFSSNVPTSNGFFRALLEGSGDQPTHLTSITDPFVIWNFTVGGTAQYASMAVLTGSDNSYVTQESFVQD